MSVLLDTLKAALLMFCVVTFSVVEQMLCCSATLVVVQWGQPNNTTIPNKGKSKNSATASSTARASLQTALSQVQSSLSQNSWFEVRNTCFLFLFIYLFFWQCDTFWSFCFMKVLRGLTLCFWQKYIYRKRTFSSKTLLNSATGGQKVSNILLNFRLHFFLEKSDKNCLPRKKKKNRPWYLQWCLEHKGFLELKT